MKNVLTATVERVAAQMVQERRIQPQQHESLKGLIATHAVDGEIDTELLPEPIKGEVERTVLARL